MKQEYTWRWARYKVEQAIEGERRALARRKAQLDYEYINISEGQR